MSVGLTSPVLPAKLLVYEQFCKFFLVIKADDFRRFEQFLDTGLVTCTPLCLFINPCSWKIEWAIALGGCVMYIESDIA